MAEAVVFVTDAGAQPCPWGFLEAIWHVGC